MTLIRHVFKKIVVLDGCGAIFVAIDPLVHEIAFERAIAIRICEQYWRGNT